jgi:hypothetical protein
MGPRFDNVNARFFNFRSSARKDFVFRMSMAQSTKKCRRVAMRGAKNEQEVDSWSISEPVACSASHQSRTMSLFEAIANVAVGYAVAVVTQILIFPVFGLHTTLAQNLKMGAVFTVVSIARSYVLRRLFERLR